MPRDTSEKRKQLLALSLVKTRNNEKIIPPRFLIKTMKENLPTIPHSTRLFGNAIKENLPTIPHSNVV